MTSSEPKEPEVATDVVKMMTNLTAATEMAGKLAATANTVSDTVTAVTDKSHETLMKLTKEAASVARAEVSDFQEAMREANAPGEGLRQRCLELRKKWDSFKSYIHGVFKQKQVGQDEVRLSIRQLQLMLECAANCSSSNKEFKEKLRHAIDVGAKLAERCRVAAEDAKSEATNTGLMGYGAAGALGVVAVGFVTFATGGVASVGAAAAGASAAGAGAYTYDRISKLDKLASEFDDLRGKLEDSLRVLNRLGDQITGLFEVTKGMVENMEIALKFFKEQERLRLEGEEMKALNEELKRKNEELEKRVQQMGI